MAEHECIIGLIEFVGGSELATLDELKEHIEDRVKENNIRKSYGLSETHWLLMKEWSLKDYCDRRKSTNLTRFDFCPMCGKKIEWKRIKEDTE